MTIVFSNLTETAASELWHYFIVFLRIGAVVSVMPGFGERMLPIRAKLGISFALTVLVAPLVSSFQKPELTSDLHIYAIFEVLIGLLLGVGLRLFTLGLQTAGAIAANATSLAQILGGASIDPLPAISHILVISALALAFAVDLHLRIIEFLILTYQIFPQGLAPSPVELAEWGSAQVSRAFTLAFTIASPFVIASLIYNLAIGAINRAMPQLMVAFVGAPIITFGGLVILMLAAPVMLDAWLNAFSSFLLDPVSAVQ